jgi:hypothetical protein
MTESLFVKSRLPVGSARRATDRRWEKLLSYNRSEVTPHSSLLGTLAQLPGINSSFTPLFARRRFRYASIETLFMRRSITCVPSPLLRLRAQAAGSFRPSPPWLAEPCHPVGYLLLRPALLALRCFDGSLRGELIKDRVAIPVGDLRDGLRILASAVDASLRFGDRLDFAHTNCLSSRIGSGS